MIARHALRLTLTCAVFAAIASPALGQGDANGQFGIAPARRDVIAHPPATLVPTQVSNTTQDSFDVTVFPVLLTQQVAGDFTFSEKPADLRAATNILTPSPAKFGLAPGARRTVSLRWNTLPPGAKAAYIGIVFQAVPIVHGKRNLRVTNRLLSINFLRLPGTYHSSGEFTGMQVLQAPQQPRVLRFQPRVKNTGDVVDTPKHTALVVEDSSGQHLYRQSWPGDVVLPGVSRDFVIDVRHIFPAGDYTAVALMDFGSSTHQIVRTNFHLTGPNTLPSPAISIANFGATGVIGKLAHLTATVLSTGTAPASTDVSLSLYHVTGGPGDARAIATKRLTYSNLPPGAKRPLDVDLGSVQSGHYRALLRFRDETNVVHTLSAEFDATKEKGFWDHVKDFFRDHGVLVIGLLALLALLLVIAWFVRRQRRLERALRERDAAPPPAGSAPAAPAAPVARAPAAPVPAPAPPGGAAAGVNINTATLAELQALPGVGPRAAERIIEHREEFGPFRSAGDLAQVRGFGPARVAELADRVVV